MPSQRAFTKQDEPRKALLLNGANPSFGKGVQIRAAWRKLQALDTLGRQHVVECRAEFRIPVVKQVAAVTQCSGRVVGSVARHLSDPGFRRVACDAGKRDTSGLQIEEEKDIVGGESTPSQHLHSEEVGAGKHSHVRRDEVLPGGGLTASWRGWNSVAPKHVSDRLVRDVMTEIGEGAGDPIVAPSGVLLGHAENQRFDFRIDARPSRVRAMLGSVELACDQTTIPAENRLGFGDTCNIGKELAAEPLADFSKCAPLRVGEPESAGQLRAENPVLCDQLFALKEKSLIHEARGVSQ